MDGSGFDRAFEEQMDWLENQEQNMRQHCITCRFWEVKRGETKAYKKGICRNQLSPVAGQEREPYTLCDWHEELER